MRLLVLGAGFSGRAIAQTFIAAGYSAAILPRKEGDALVYHVLIRNLPSRAEAQALGNRLKGQFGITEPRVSG